MILVRFCFVLIGFGLGCCLFYELDFMLYKIVGNVVRQGIADVVGLGGIDRIEIMGLMRHPCHWLEKDAALR